jgi:hypothetical protein
MTLAVAEQKRRVAKAERRAAEANRRVANFHAAERRAEEVANAERYAVEAEQRANEAERRVADSRASKASAVERCKPLPAANAQPKPITAPAPTPAQRHTPKEIPVMSTRRQILFRDVATTTARLASARQSLEDARFLVRNGMGDDGGIAFALHVEAGAFRAWLKASEAFQACRD